MTDRPPYPGTPRWVKVSAIIVIVLVLLVVIIMFTGVGGEHGPGRHIPSGAPGGHTPSGSNWALADINPNMSCPAESTPRHGPGGEGNG